MKRNSAFENDFTGSPSGVSNVGCAVPRSYQLTLKCPVFMLAKILTRSQLLANSYALVAYHSETPKPLFRKKMVFVDAPDDPSYFPGPMPAVNA